MKRQIEDPAPKFTTALDAVLWVLENIHRYDTCTRSFEREVRRRLDTNTMSPDTCIVRDMGGDEVIFVYIEQLLEEVLSLDVDSIQIPPEGSDATIWYFVLQVHEMTGLPL
jgi:hypothetical protein